MRFCTHCQSLLYPQENNGRLFMYCRWCQQEYETNDIRVHVNKIIRSPNELTTVYQDVASDPTLPHADKIQCPECATAAPLYFQASRDPDSGMKLYFVCSNRSCSHRWTD